MADGAVGIIGLGNIGNGIATAQVKSGNWPVYVWDYDETKSAAFKGMTNVTVASPRKMASAVDVLLFVVPSTKEIRLCLEGDEGIFLNAKPGLVIYDLTTSYPDDSKAVCEEAKEYGITYLDAGTSGGPAATSGAVAAACSQAPVRSHGAHVLPSNRSHASSATRLKSFRGAGHAACGRVRRDDASAATSPAAFAPCGSGRRRRDATHRRPPSFTSSLQWCRPRSPQTPCAALRSRAESDEGKQ